MKYFTHIKDNLLTAYMHLGYFFQFLLHAICPCFYKRAMHAGKMWRYAVTYNEKDGMLHPVSLMIITDGVSATLEFMDGESEWLRNSLAPQIPDEPGDYPEEVLDIKNFRKGLFGRCIRRMFELVSGRSTDVNHGKRVA